MRSGWWRWGMLAAAALSVGAGGDDRGWGTGKMAANAAVVLKGPAERPIIALPKDLAIRVTQPTVLFYFAPNCPHCRHVAREIQALSERISGKATLLGIASGSASADQLAEFRSTFGVTFEILVDTDREIQAAMGVQSTPVAMLVAPPEGKTKTRSKVEVRDMWFPYVPGWDALIEGRIEGDIWGVFAPDRYLGNNLCGSCHLEEHASWQLTHHSVAWRTLVRGENTADPKCTGCHVTGASQPGGWDGDPDSALVDVGCEACHGPGGPHDGVRTEARDACKGCHDAEHSIAFTVQKGLPLIDHYRVSQMAEAEYDAARRALYAGEAPRELLAFAKGKNVGSAACLSCHALEHAWWADDPHARGMSSLDKEGSTDPACVRCHATAKASGPPPTTLAGFDTLGGVGCESCHGPGEAHVAAGGGTDNIEGLGESCPVCVIEAVCTSCHTPKWSPDWDLTERLSQITHGPPAPPE